MSIPDPITWGRVNRAMRVTGAEGEPAETDIPKVFFTGIAPSAKSQGELPLTMEYRSRTLSFKSYVTLKVQGDSSASYPKKNFNMEMYKDEKRTAEDKRRFRGWSSTHKYCLKANWIDHTHARNVVGGRLWGRIVQSRADYDSYPAAYRASANCGAVDGFPVKVYLNGVYQGLYTWNIRKDASMFNMDEACGVHSALIGDAPNTVTVWRALPAIDGSDWTDELNDTVPDGVRTGFENAYSFVMNATDEAFKARADEYFYLSSLIDYYIYIYCNLMIGGLSKSQTMLTYDGRRFMANIYDMDTTWGLHWNGKSFYDTETPCPSGYTAQTEVGVSNLLYERVAALFPDEIAARYAELRETVLSDGSIIGEFERFMDVIPAELYGEETALTTAGGAFAGIPSADTNTLQKLREVIAVRMAYCDAQLLPASESTVVWAVGGLDAGGQTYVSSKVLRTVGYIPEAVVRVSVPEDYLIAAVCYDDDGGVCTVYNADGSVNYPKAHVQGGYYNFAAANGSFWCTSVELAFPRSTTYHNIALIIKRADSGEIEIGEAVNVMYEFGDPYAIKWVNGAGNRDYTRLSNRLVTLNVFKKFEADTADGYQMTAFFYDENWAFVGYPAEDGGIVSADTPAWLTSFAFNDDTYDGAAYCRVVVRRSDSADIGIDEAQNIIVTEYSCGSD